MIDKEESLKNGTILPGEEDVATIHPLRPIAIVEEI
tara:strand:- start:376 stop:483 length:108 start_codon:yes stop_codon:yes gene_type:complete